MARGADARPPRGAVDPGAPFTPHGTWGLGTPYITPQAIGRPVLNQVNADAEDTPLPSKFG